MTAIYHCLHHASAIAAEQLPADQVGARLSRVPEACEHPDRCGHAERGCRAVNRDHLAGLYRRAGVAAEAKARRAAQEGR